MPISPDALLTIIAGVVIFLFASFARLRRGSRPPVTLDLYAGRVPPRPLDRAPEDGREVSLNAYFNYNGHLWDAYEALGLPGGSSVPSARRAFARATGAAHAASRPFLEEALKAIESKGR